MPELDKSYNPEGLDEKWYQNWLGKGYFNPDASSGDPFSIVIPPPNVTGSLHMGHALNASLQDTLIRRKRMQGFKSLWVPGTDHAGIATQNVVEKELAKKGIDRHSLGREQFIEEVWKWKGEYGGRIVNQLKRLGASCDWTRQRFTMDDGLSRAVREVFVRLYEEGLIYRDNRLINWCPRCRTALSDLEVEHEEIEGVLTYIRYPLSGKGGYITVATTRPETMLGDAAVAVHPDDDRYRYPAGTEIDLPLTGRKIPLIFDNAVDASFGTGAVKVTPAHDFNDEAIAKRQNPQLPSMTVIGKDGTMTALAGARYSGMDRYECRKKLFNDLKEAGFIDREERHVHSVGHCYRCKTIIEPLSTPQWYVAVGPMAAAAMDAVRGGRIRIYPASWENTYFAWMGNIKDWCISRQIWWGHRIPVWYCDGCGGINVSRGTPGSCRKCGSNALRQDEDVLDTWFSSALWPFSTLGWPDALSKDLGVFYPTSVLVTGFDILFFWVARMIMMGLKFMGEVPFKDVYIHALVRDSKGQKMSKSKGNVVDPLIMIEKYGTDAFRFSLAAFAAQGRDIKFSEDRVEGYRNFVNKLWNAARFILMNIKTATNDELQKIKELSCGLALESGHRTLELKDRWILSRLALVAGEVNSSLEEYRFNDAAGSIYQFIWHEFCDWYIEMSKGSIYNDDGTRTGTIACLLSVLDNSLRLLHPFMPFVTEELWQCVKGYVSAKEESITMSRYPESMTRDLQAEGKMACIMDAIAGIRTVRGELNIPPSADVRVIILSYGKDTETILGDGIDFIKRLAKAAEITIATDIKKPKGCAVGIREKFEVYIPVEGLLDINGEIERMTKEQKKIRESLAFLDKKLTSKDFLKRAPADIVEKEQTKHQDLAARDKRIESNIRLLRELEA